MNASPISPNNPGYDVAIVGGGIVGLATAREFLQRDPRRKLIVIEKETEIAAHQTGHNSGVIHSGIYYKPGSAKARMCVVGHAAMIAFCKDRGIPYEECGKVIVALDESELPALEDIYQRGLKNGVPDIVRIDPPRLHEIEPNAAGIKAIYLPHTGIVDYKKVAHAYADDICAAGGEIRTGTRVQQIVTQPDGSTVITDKGEIQAKLVVTCAGLYSDKMGGQPETPFKIIPFRGDYYSFKPERRHLVKGLLYPVPDPRFPFLGVHYTRVMSGEVWIGPNAVLAFAREGYGRWDVNLGELVDMLVFPGFWKMAAKYWEKGISEMYADYVKSAYLKRAQRYMPIVTADDLIFGPSGVRAQALDINGGLVDDFVIQRGSHVLHVYNAPSPAATSSLIIARTIVDEAAQIA
jgi:L-2-hydroxyglutarate oxidase LhgO